MTNKKLESLILSKIKNNKTINKVKNTKKNEDDISIKATTNETMGFIGRKEGLVAYAVCLIEKIA